MDTTPEPGLVGGGVGAVSAGPPCVLQMRAPHGLADGERVRVGPPLTNGGRPKLFYVRSTGYQSNEFAPFQDAALKIPAPSSGIAAGADVARLAVRDYAVVAGINYYPSYSSLNGAVGDAKRFGAWLKSTAFLPEDQVFEIAASSAAPSCLEEARPWLDDIKTRFESLAQLAARKDLYYLGRRLYIFLSGHGILPAGGNLLDANEAALLMANTDTLTMSNHIAARAYAERFRAPAVFDEVVVLADCCRDWEETVPLTTPVFTLKLKREKPGIKFYLRATQMDSKSREKSMGTPPECRGIFSSALMDALDSPGLCDRNGLLTGKILADRVTNDVWLQTKKQMPDPEYDSDFVFLKRRVPPPPNVTIRFDPSVHGQTFDIRGGKNFPNPDATRTASAAPWDEVLDAPPWIYVLRSRETGRETVITLDGSKEKIVDVA
jgi:hypothetical protein